MLRRAVTFAERAGRLPDGAVADGLRSLSGVSSNIGSEVGGVGTTGSRPATNGRYRRHPDTRCCAEGGRGVAGRCSVLEGGEKNWSDTEGVAGDRYEGDKGVAGEDTELVEGVLFNDEDVAEKTASVATWPVPKSSPNSWGYIPRGG